MSKKGTENLLKSPFISCCLRAIPTWRLWCDRRHNRPKTDDCAPDCAPDHPVGMPYLLDNWATDRWAIAGQRETADLYQACLIFHSRLIAGWRLLPSNHLLGDGETQCVCPFTEMIWCYNVYNNLLLSTSTNVGLSNNVWYYIFHKSIAS